MIEVIGKAGITVKMIKDSISEDGVRLTTMQLHYHRYIHSEFMTHRVFSRNASSSRAIPVKTLLKQVRENPMMPIHWGSNKPGMQAGEELSSNGLGNAIRNWKAAAMDTADRVEYFEFIGLHKQVANRLLEPFLAINVVVTATEWSNWFMLRDHKDAQPEIQELARCMKQCMDESEPKTLLLGHWHLPYVSDEEMSNWDIECVMEQGLRSSAARCARVSYLNHDKTGCTIEGDNELFNMLATRPYNNGKGHILGADDPVHLSPLEHQGTPIDYDSEGLYIDNGVTHMDKDDNEWSGNFRGWIQYRQLL